MSHCAQAKQPGRSIRGCYIDCLLWYLSFHAAIIAQPYSLCYNRLTFKIRMNLFVYCDEDNNGPVRLVARNCHAALVNKLPCSVRLHALRSCRSPPSCVYLCYDTVFACRAGECCAARLSVWAVSRSASCCPSRSCAASRSGVSALVPSSHPQIRGALRWCTCSPTLVFPQLPFSWLSHVCLPLAPVLAPPSYAPNPPHHLPLLERTR